MHDLVREAVGALLAAAERVRLHRGAADVVERLHVGRLEAHLSDLARHWAAVAVSGDREQAAQWITRANEEAMRRLAYEEAAGLYRLALTAGAGDIDDERRCRLLLGTAGALKAAGELSGRLPAAKRRRWLARCGARTCSPRRRWRSRAVSLTSKPRARCGRSAKRPWRRCLRRRVP